MDAHRVGGGGYICVLFFFFGLDTFHVEICKNLDLYSNTYSQPQCMMGTN